MSSDFAPRPVPGPSEPTAGSDGLPGAPGPSSGPEDRGQDPELRAPGTPADPLPLGVDRTATGHPEVDARLGPLADVDHLATDGHLEVYENVHRGLRDTLTALDDRTGPPVPAPQREPAPSYDHRS
jgi:hypothetical protein